MARRIVIINDFSIALGGATGLALLSAKLFRESGIDVTYIAGDEGDPAWSSEIAANSICIGGNAINEKQQLSSAINGLYNISARDRIADYIKNNDHPDTIYHVHGWSKILSPSIFSALAPVSYRTVIHAHDFFLICPNGGQFHYKKEETCFLKPLSLECLASNCDKRNYVNKLWRFSRQTVLHHLVHHKTVFPKILLIHEKMAPFFTHAGINADRLQVVHNPATAFSAQRVPVENNRYAYFIGRVVEEKGVEDAIMACSLTNVPLRVIGDGALRHELEKKFPAVEFMGWRTPSDIRDLIQQARVLLMPSRYPEPFGLVALEAAQSGVPVIISNTSFLADELAAAGIARHVNTRNLQEFSATLREINQMPAEQIMAMGQCGIALKAVTAENWRDSLLDHYTQLIGRC